MLIRMCMAKIHRATVTDADLNYAGSITIDAALLQAAGLREFQYVNITNLSNGTYWQTYIIPGAQRSGVICLNGPPARHFHRGDKVIILAEAWVTESEAEALSPKLVFVDERNISEPIPEVWNQFEGHDLVRRLSMMRIMARRTKAAPVLA